MKVFNEDEISPRQMPGCIPPEYYFDLRGQSARTLWETFKDQGMPPATAYLATVEYCPDDGFVGLVRYTRTGWDYIVLRHDKTAPTEYQEMGDELAQILSKFLPEEKENEDEQERPTEHGEETKEDERTGHIVSESPESS